jgi:outer membrane protein
MKRLLKRLIPGLLLFSLLGGSAFAQTKIATVNLEKLFANYWKTRQANQVLEDNAAKMKKSHDDLLENFRKAKEDYQKLLDSASDPVVSTDERDKRKKNAEDKLKDLKALDEEIGKFEREASANISAQKDTYRKRILDEIKLVISGKAKSAGYVLVVDSGAQTYMADPSGPYYTPTLLYIETNTDITDAVLTQLNSGAPGDVGTKPAETPALKPAKP